MKISIIMVDGGFRENIFSAEYFLKQDFPNDQYEIIWVDFFNAPHHSLSTYPNIKVCLLDKKGTYHSSYCFNRGIQEATGEIIVIPDADQIVKPDFLSKVWDIHCNYEKLVVYGYRYDETQKDDLRSFDFKELEQKCILKNPLNYGGCLTVRKKWLLEVNGYEQHPVLQSGFHANGLDMYTRFKNFGLAIQWDQGLKLYHPWHTFSLVGAEEYKVQKQFIEWRHRNIQWTAFDGINPEKNSSIPEELKAMWNGNFHAKANTGSFHYIRSLLKCCLKRI